MVKRLWQRLKDWLWCRTHGICCKHFQEKEWFSASSFENVKMMCAEWAAKAKTDTLETRLTKMRKRRGLEW